MKIQKFDQFNIPGICKCEFTLAANVQSISFPDDDHQVTIDLKPGIEFDEIRFTSSSVDRVSKLKRDNSGRYYTNQVKLSNPKITGEKAGIFKDYEEQDLVFLLSATNGLKVLIGTPEMPARMTYTLNNPAAGRNQRSIDIDALSDEEPYFVIDSIVITGGGFSDGFSDGFRT